MKDRKDNLLTLFPFGKVQPVGAGEGQKACEAQPRPSVLFLGTDGETHSADPQHGQQRRWATWFSVKVFFYSFKAQVILWS